jgi:hypothetical protein
MKKSKTIMVCLVFSIFSCRNTGTNNPLDIEQNTIDALLGELNPVLMYELWGAPETLDGTDNKYWVYYLSKGNISLVSKKSDSIVIFAKRGKSAAIDYKLKEL